MTVGGVVIPAAKHYDAKRFALLANWLHGKTARNEPVKALRTEPGHRFRSRPAREMRAIEWPAGVLIGESNRPIKPGVIDLAAFLKPASARGLPPRHPLPRKDDVRPVQP